LPKGGDVVVGELRQSERHGVVPRRRGRRICRLAWILFLKKISDEGVVHAVWWPHPCRVKNSGGAAVEVESSA